MILPLNGKVFVFLSYELAIDDIIDSEIYKGN